MIESYENLKKKGSFNNFDTVTRGFEMGRNSEPQGRVGERSNSTGRRR